MYFIHKYIKWVLQVGGIATEKKKHDHRNEHEIKCGERERERKRELNGRIFNENDNGKINTPSFRVGASQFAVRCVCVCV